MKHKIIDDFFFYKRQLTNKNYTPLPSKRNLAKQKQIKENPKELTR